VVNQWFPGQFVCPSSLYLFVGGVLFPILNQY
jgi:hypothetical protein